MELLGVIKDYNKTYKNVKELIELEDFIEYDNDIMEYDYYQLLDEEGKEIIRGNYKKVKEYIMNKIERSF